MRAAAVVLVWTAAAIVLVVSAFSAFVGRADFGDGRAASRSAAELLGLLALDAVVIALAVWVTRVLRRRA